MVLVSAVAFGTTAIFAKLAYASGLGTLQALAFRFGLAAVGMWTLAWLAGQNPMRLGRRAFTRFGLLGLVVYTSQSLTYFLALRSLPASLVVLIVYIYPSLVVIGARVFLGRRINRWLGLAVAGSFLGVALLVGGARFQLAWGLVFALASPTIYSGYILIGERLMSGAPAIGASAVIMAGAGLAFITLAGLNHELALPREPSGWAVALGVALVPTMVAISLFMAGLPRVGAARAALLSTVEPLVTVGLAVALLGDRLTAEQVMGGCLVLASVVLVQTEQLWSTASNATVLK